MPFNAAAQADALPVLPVLCNFSVNFAAYVDLALNGASFAFKSRDVEELGCQLHFPDYWNEEEIDFALQFVPSFKKMVDNKSFRLKLLTEAQRSETIDWIEAQNRVYYNTASEQDKELVKKPVSYWDQDKLATFKNKMKKGYSVTREENLRILRRHGSDSISTDNGERAGKAGIVNVVREHMLWMVLDSHLAIRRRDQKMCQGREKVLESLNGVQGASLTTMLTKNIINVVMDNCPLCKNRVNHGAVANRQANLAATQAAGQAAVAAPVGPVQNMAFNNGSNFGQLAEEPIIDPELEDVAAWVERRRVAENGGAFDQPMANADLVQAGMPHEGAGNHNEGYFPPVNADQDVDGIQNQGNGNEMPIIGMPNENFGHANAFFDQGNAVEGFNFDGMDIDNAAPFPWVNLQQGHTNEGNNFNALPNEGANFEGLPMPALDNQGHFYFGEGFYAPPNMEESGPFNGAQDGPNADFFCGGQFVDPRFLSMPE